MRNRSSAFSLAKVLLRLTELGQTDDTSAADVVLRPDLASYGRTDTASMRTIIGRGRLAAEQALEAGEL